MFEKEALRVFSRQPVSEEMIQFLVATTKSVIHIKRPAPELKKLNDTGMLYTQVDKKSVSLSNFIKRLIEYSNVQTPTLMATLIYLNKLRKILPANAIDMETTRHRIFLASLILSAKSLNDSSPLNKHWTRYTDGLLSIEDVNMAERELIALLKWDVVVKEDDLLMVLQPFLARIKIRLMDRYQEECNKKIAYYKISDDYSTNKSRSTSSSSISSYKSNLSLHSSQSSSSLSSATLSSTDINKLGAIDELPRSAEKRIPLMEREQCAQCHKVR